MLTRYLHEMPIEIFEILVKAAKNLKFKIYYQPIAMQHWGALSNIDYIYQDFYLLEKSHQTSRLTSRMKQDIVYLVSISSRQ